MSTRPNVRSGSSAAEILDVPLSDADVAMMLLTGFARRDPDGVLALTEKGGEWLREWCKKEAAKHGK